MNSKQSKLVIIRKLIDLVKQENEDLKILTNHNGVNAFQIKNPYAKVGVLKEFEKNLDNVKQTVSYSDVEAIT